MRRNRRNNGGMVGKFTPINKTNLTCNSRNPLEVVPGQNYVTET